MNGFFQKKNYVPFIYLCQDMKRDFLQFKTYVASEALLDNGFLAFGDASFAKSQPFLAFTFFTSLKSNLTIFKLEIFHFDTN